MWKEPVIANSEVLLRQLRGGTFCNTPQSRQPVFGPRFESVDLEKINFLFSPLIRYILSFCKLHLLTSKVKTYRCP